MDKEGENIQGFEHFYFYGNLQPLDNFATMFVHNFEAAEKHKRKMEVYNHRRIRHHMIMTYGPRTPEDIQILWKFAVRENYDWDDSEDPYKNEKPEPSNSSPDADTLKSSSTDFTGRTINGGTLSLPVSEAKRGKLWLLLDRQLGRESEVTPDQDAARESSDRKPE